MQYKNIDERREAFEEQFAKFGSDEESSGDDKNSFAKLFMLEKTDNSFSGSFDQGSTISISD